MKGRGVLIYDAGIPRTPTPQEKGLPSAEGAPFRGCPVFVVSAGRKHWCQAGTSIHHEGTHCG